MDNLKVTDVHRSIYECIGKLVGHELRSTEWKPILRLIREGYEAKDRHADGLQVVIQEQKIRIKNQSEVLYQLQNKIKRSERK